MILFFSSYKITKVWEADLNRGKVFSDPLYVLPLGSDELPVEPVLDDLVLLLFVLHLVDHGGQLGLGLLHAHLVALNPDDSGVGVAVRDVDGHVALVLQPVH